MFGKTVTTICSNFFAIQLYSELCQMQDGFGSCADGQTDTNVEIAVATKCVQKTVHQTIGGPGKDGLACLIRIQRFNVVISFCFFNLARFKYLYPQLFEIHLIEYKRNRDKHNNRTSYNKPTNDNNSGSGNNKDNNIR